MSFEMGQCFVLICAAILIVINGCKAAITWATAPVALAARDEHKKELACLSPLGKKIIAARSGHFPQFMEPGLIVAAVWEAVDAFES